MLMYTHLKCSLEVHLCSLEVKLVCDRFLAVSVDSVPSHVLSGSAQCRQDDQSLLHFLARSHHVQVSTQ